MKLYTFGSNMGSQLARPDDIDSIATPTLVFEHDNIQKIAAGAMHNVALIDNQVYSWGCNDEFALGRSGLEHEILMIDPKYYRDERVVEISAGCSHSALLTEKGNVYAWGTFRDRSGVLGFKFGVKFQKTPKLIEKGIKSLNSTDNCIMMIKKSGSVVAYGPELIKKARRVKNYSSLNSRVIKRASKNNIEKIACGSDHCFGFTSSGAVLGWGNNFCGQLGNGSKVNLNNNNFATVGLSDVVMAEGGPTHSMFIDNAGNLYGCGQNNNAQLGSAGVREMLVPERIMSGVRTVKCSAMGCLAVKEDGVYAWGTDDYGELGFDGQKIATPRKMRYSFEEILMIEMGSNHTVIVTKK